MDTAPPDLLPLSQGFAISILPDGTAVGRFLRTDLSSVFQPLIDSGSGACAGHEAFVRVHGQGELSITPWNLFSLVANGRLLAAVLEDHGRTFRHAVDKLDLDPARIVIETPEAANLDRKLLALVLSNYRLNGFAVAANTLGIADLESLLLMVRPDFVKIDARRVLKPEGCAAENAA